MKNSAWVVCAVVIGALGLQGCASAGDMRPDAAQPANTTAPVSAQPAPAVAASGASIPQENGKPVVKADSKENFETIVAAIHQQMQPGGRWQFIDKGERATVDGNFADMQKLYDQYGGVDKMDSNAKIRLLADQSSVNAILTKKDGDRLICQTEMPVGSHLPVKTCKTYAQVQAEQNHAQQYLRSHSGTMQEKACGSGGIKC